jgi:hypothetical protein
MPGWAAEYFDPCVGDDGVEAGREFDVVIPDKNLTRAEVQLVTSSDHLDLAEHVLGAVEHHHGI